MQTVAVGVDATYNECQSSELCETRGELVEDRVPRKIGIILGCIQREVLDMQGNVI